MAVINKEIAYMALPLSIRRGNPFPIDEYSVWYDMEELTNYNRIISLKREVSPMNLYISAAEYDYHTLLKVAEMAGLAGIIGFHEAGDGYLVTFPQGENVQALIDDYKGRLRDLENNIW